MGNQIGIPEYKEYVNSFELADFKKMINAICIDFAAMSCQESVENRESDKYELYFNQYQKDLANLKNMVYYAQGLVNKINDLMYNISNGALQRKNPDE